MPLDQQAINDALAAHESAFVNEVVNNRPHPGAGLSNHAVGIATQKLVLHYPRTFDKGMTERGTVFHTWYYQNHPVGMKFTINVAGTPLDFEIKGHEQIVKIHDQNGRLVRQTYIDVLVYCYTTHQWEYWDLKNNAGAANKGDEADELYKAQVNLEAYLDSRKEGLPYRPMCRILISDPMNWNEMIFQSWEMDPVLGQWSIDQITEYEHWKPVPMDKISRKDWAGLISVCSNRWKTGRLYYIKPDGKRGYKSDATWRVTCDRCDNWEHCMDILGLPHDRDKLLEDPNFFKNIKGAGL